MAKQITLRGVSQELSRRLEHLAQARGKSLNATVLEILERAAGIHGRKERLARYATWTADDLLEFEQALRIQRVVDKRLWE